MSNRLSLLALTLAAAPGCIFSGMKQYQDSLQASNAQLQANAAAAATDMFVIADRVWLCPSEQAALAGTRCDGGTEVLKNRVVTVIGQAPKDGVWPVSLWDQQGEHKLFAVAARLSDQPDTRALEEFASDVDRRFPEAKRIPLRTISFADLERPAAFKGRYLVARVASSGMTNKDFAHAFSASRCLSLSPQARSGARSHSSSSRTPRSSTISRKAAVPISAGRSIATTSCS
jgi:hypothetical protein